MPDPLGPPDEIAALVRLEGLEKTFAEFPDEVLEAAAAAAALRTAFSAPQDPAEEPWPPMQPGDAL